MAHGVQEEFALLVDVLARFLVRPDELYELLGHSVCLNAGLPVDGRAGSLGLLDLCWENLGHSRSGFKQNSESSYHFESVFFSCADNWSLICQAWPGKCWIFLNTAIVIRHNSRKMEYSTEGGHLEPHPHLH